MPLDEKLKQARAELHESIGLLKEMLDEGKPTPKALAYLEKRLITPLIEEGHVIKREHLRTFFEMNFDFLKDHIISVCPNQEFLLDMVKERMNELDMREVFNPEAYMEAKDEGKPPPPLFLKFLVSYLAYYRQEMFFSMLIQFKRDNIDIRELFR